MFRDTGPKPLPSRSPTRKGLNLHAEMLSNKNSVHRAQLSLEDRFLLEEVTKRRTLAPGRSKSQEFAVAKKGRSKIWAVSRSTGSSPRVELGHPKANVLDVLDGLDTSY